MKRLDTLIRVRQWQLNENRRRVVELEASANRARARIRSLDGNIEAEGRDADRAGAGSGFATYAAAVRERRHQLSDTQGTVADEPRHARAADAEDYPELTEFEFVRGPRKQRPR